MNIMATTQIRIKDIALRAGVSVGTVDRVLHDRPNVSSAARKKVEAALAEMDYQPNVYASALAYNKDYTFYCIIPQHDSEAYWEEIEEGVKEATQLRRDFHVSLQLKFYERFNEESFVGVTNECLNSNPDGVIIVPAKLEPTTRFAEELHERNIPFILLDSYLPDLKPLAFFGQDSFQSGYFAARMMMLIASRENGSYEIANPTDENIAQVIEIGNMEAMKRSNCAVAREFFLLDADRNDYTRILEEFFTSHPQIHHGITFNSKAHLVGLFLLRTNRRNVQIMGYDMVPKNAECVRRGSISFLIAQHAFMQGHACVETLFKAIVLKQEVTPVNYMPIELLTKENIEFYRRTNVG